MAVPIVDGLLDWVRRIQYCSLVFSQDRFGTDGKLSGGSLQGHGNCPKLWSAGEKINRRTDWLIVEDEYSSYSA